MTDQDAIPITDTGHPYDRLTPDIILNAVESVGHVPDGRLLALNSYENRVYQVGLNDGDTLVAKFYRPGRWSDAAIQEEHDYSAALAAIDLPVVAPLRDEQGRSLFRFEGFRFSLSPRRGGRTLDLEDMETLFWLGRLLGRMHTLGAARPFAHRPQLTVQSFGRESLAYVLAADFVPEDLRIAYATLGEDILKQVEAGFAAAGEVASIRLHGDCHPGNILWTDEGPHFVDFDDARMGPAVQDLWMLLSGDRVQMTAQLDEVLSGYSQFRDFNARELHLIEPLRTLRMLHYSAWLARRWDDPSFPHNFPWFGEPRYWEEQILALREQAALMNEPPLVWFG